MSNMPPAGSDFDKAVTQEKRLGYNGEVTDWVEQDLDLARAAESMCINWGFTDRLSVLHESLHVVLALLVHTHPKLMKGKSYQGDNWSEIYRAQMQKYVESTIIDKEDFTLYLQRSASNGGVKENASNVLAWLLAPLLGKTVQDLKNIDDSGVLPFAALQEGIEVDFVYTQGYGKKTMATIVSPEYGVFKAFESSIEFPEGFSKQHEITPFVVPTPNEAGAMFDALQPALDFLRAEWAKDESALSRIKVSQIVELLKAGASSQPKPDVIRGMDVQPA